MMTLNALLKHKRGSLGKIPVYKRVTVCYYALVFLMKDSNAKLYIMCTDFPFVKIINPQMTRGQKFFKRGQMPPCAPLVTLIDHHV